MQEENNAYFEGEVFNAHPEKGYSFIKYLNEAGRKENIFVHCSNVQGSEDLVNGDRVTFRTERKPDGRTQAVEVEIVARSESFTE